MKKTINMPEVRVINFESKVVIATSSMATAMIDGGTTEYALGQERSSSWD